MKMKFFAAFSLFLILIPSMSLGQDLSSLLGEDYTTVPFASLNLVELKYEPYPAEPGEYVTLWIQVYNRGLEEAKNVAFELKTGYPFSLHPDETAKRSFSKIPGLYTVILQYKLKVDKDVMEGWENLKIKYSINGGASLEKDMEVYVTKPASKAELKAFYISSEPKAYPGGEATLSINLANIASGTAYYTIIEAETEIADIEVSEIFIGTMDADDSDTIDFDLEIGENAEPGKYPVKIKSYYKDEDDRKYETEDTVYIRVYSQEEVMEEMQTETPWWQYLVYVIVALVAIKYFLVPPVKKLVSFLKNRKKK